MPVKDVSFWSSHAVDNIILEIKVPGRDSYSKFLIQKSELKIVNCSDLAICKGGMSDLPDGTYRMKLSYNPNLETITEFYHFRDVLARKRFASAICELKSNVCNLSKRNYLQLEENLIKVDFNLKAAKYAVEDCGDIDMGTQLYAQALKDLESYSNCNC